MEDNLVFSNNEYWSDIKESVEKQYFSKKKRSFPVLSPTFRGGGLIKCDEFLLPKI